MGIGDWPGCQQPHIRTGAHPRRQESGRGGSAIYVLHCRVDDDGTNE